MIALDRSHGVSRMLRQDSGLPGQMVALVVAPARKRLVLGVHP